MLQAVSTPVPHCMRTPEGVATCSTWNTKGRPPKGASDSVGHPDVGPGATYRPPSYDALKMRCTLDAQVWRRTSFSTVRPSIEYVTCIDSGCTLPSVKASLSVPTCC